MQLEGVEPPAPRPDRLPVQDLGVYEKHGGHTLRKHVDVKPGEEFRRILREGIAAAGRFINRATAQRCVEQSIWRHSDEVRAWLAGPEASVPLVFTQDMGYVVGRMLTWDDVSHGLVTPRPVTGVRLVLRRRAELPGGFTVVTAYPARSPRRARSQEVAS